MGEIIKFDFNNKKKIKESNFDKNNEAAFSGDEELKKAAEPFIKFIRFVISDKHKRFINLKITQFASSEIKKTVSQYSNEELIGWLLDYDEDDWVKKPSFYRAVYDEMKNRLPDKFKGNLE